VNASQALLRTILASETGLAETVSSPVGSHAARDRVVVVGGGFGGLAAVRALQGVPVDVTLIDRRNFHLFQPLLYQVATGQLSPADIASSLRAVVGRQSNVSVLEGEVVDILPDEQRIVLRDGEVVLYDTLIFAVGSTLHYFGRDEWAARAPGLKTVEDATAMRSRILAALERAERTTSPELRRALLTFVIVGGGPTGVELAGAIAELTRHTLRDEYRSIDPAEAEILLLEGTERILPSYPPSLSEKAASSLARLGVTVLTSTLVDDIQQHTVELNDGERCRCVPAGNVMWAAGVKASPLNATVAKRTGVALDRSGRLVVASDCSLPDHPNIFAIGDMASLTVDDRPLPGVAPVAMQQGTFVAKLIRRRLAGRTPRPFRYRDWGSLAVIGRAAAVANVRGFRFSGLFAWLLWLFVHILQLVEFENRIQVLSRWFFSYVAGKRSARLITQPEKDAPSTAAELPWQRSPVPSMTVPTNSTDRRVVEPQAGATHG
jgi:NADH dehydrogenase